MAFRRMAMRRRPRRSFKGKRSFTRRFKRSYRNKNAGGNKKYFFKRTFIISKDLTGATFLPATAAEQEHTIQNLTSYSEFTNLFDQFKICGIKQKFVWSHNSGDTGTNGTNDIPTLYTVNDYNDSTAIADENEILQQQTFRAKRLDKVVSRYFRPKQLITTPSSNTATGSLWNTCATSADAVHYGLKWAVGLNSSVLTYGKLKVYTTYYIALKNVK